MEFYSKSINYGDGIISYNKAILYEYIGNKEKIIELYEYAFSKGIIDAIYRLGLYYENNTEFDKMYECYFNALRNGNTKAIKNLNSHFEFNDNKKKMCEYYLIAVNIDKEKYLKIINDYITANFNLEDALIFYDYLSKNNLNKLNKKIINYYEVDNLGVNSKCILNSILDGEDECCICLEINIKLNLKCKHKICIDCYKKINKCPFCRDIIKENKTNQNNWMHSVR